MKAWLFSFFAYFGLSWAIHGAIPGALKLLPSDTLGFVTTPDWTKARSAWETNNLGRLWNDPAMRPFRERFEKRLREEFGDHIKMRLGIQLTDYFALAQGQVTVAFVRGDWRNESASKPPWVLVLDAGEKAAELKPMLEDAVKKLRAANKSLKTLKIRDTEFTTVILDPADLRKLRKNPAPAPANKEDPDDEDDAPPKRRASAPSKLELTFGRSGTALLLTSSPEAIERIVARLEGGTIDSIDSQERFQSGRQSVLGQGLIQAWVDVTPFTSDLVETFGGLLAMLGADTRKAASALGLDALQWAAASLQESPDGTTVHSALGVPEARRAGLFKLIQCEPKDASPPAFIPADAVKFQRWRLDGPKFWKTLEDSLNRISPQLLGLLKLTLNSAGQQDDPNFTFKSELIDRLGDDLITFEKAPRGRTLPELNDPPSIILLGSPKPERLVNGLRAIMMMSQMQSGDGGIQVREFLGRKIYSARLTTTAGRVGPRTYMAAGTGYVALSRSAGLIEDFLRPTEGSGRSLKDFPGLAAAADRIGGWNSGLCLFENQLESSRASWELLRQGGSLDRVMPPGTANLEMAKSIQEWAEFSLLPDFDKVARYFTFGVMVGTADANAFHLRWFAPAGRDKNGE